MKKRLAHWLLAIAKKLDQQTEFEFADRYEPKKLGIGYQITVEDVKRYRKEHPELTSLRKALDALIEDTKKEVGTNIFAGIYKNELIHYDVKKALFSAVVKGELYVYAHKESEE